MRKDSCVRMQEKDEKSHIKWRMKNLALLLMACIMVMSVGMEAKAANSMLTAVFAEFDKSYTGTLAGEEENWYSFKMESSGCVKLKSLAQKTDGEASGVRYTLYDSDGKKITDSYTSYNSSGISSSEIPYHLTKGSYYFTVRQDAFWGGNGNFSLSLSFTSAEESFAESGMGTNNSFSGASAISLGKTYKGQLAWNDDRDYYKFTLPSSGRVSFSLQAWMEYMDFHLYNSEGVEVWPYKNYHWDSVLARIVSTETFDLTKGTYYFVFQKDGRYNIFGNYSFGTSFASAGESFEETGEGTNNSMDTANGIDLNKTYKGQLALNDSEDWYQFSLSSATEVTLKVGADMERISFYIYNASGTQQASQFLSWDAVTKKISYSGKLSLPAGKWWIKVVENDDNTGKYSISVNTHSHTYKKYVTKATTSKDGKVVEKCSKCGKVKSTKTIYRIKKVSLSDTGYTYNGKAKKPSVTVKDSKGKKISSSSYTVTYASGRKNVGSYKVTIKFKGNYSGTVTKTFKINPPKTQITGLKAQKKGFRITLKNQKTQTTGYQIQYATDKNFRNATLKAIKNSKNSAAYTNLKAGRKYYVRVRTYKTVSGKTYYSSWSDAKSVKTK